MKSYKTKMPRQRNGRRALGYDALGIVALGEAIKELKRSLLRKSPPGPFLRCIGCKKRTRAGQRVYVVHERCLRRMR